MNKNYKRLLDLLEEVGFDTKEIKIVNDLSKFEEIMPNELMELFYTALGYFIQESYRKGKLKGIEDVEDVIHKNTIKFAIK